MAVFTAFFTSSSVAAGIVSITCIVPGSSTPLTFLSDESTYCPPMIIFIAIFLLGLILSSAFYISKARAIQVILQFAAIIKTKQSLKIQALFCFNLYYIIILCTVYCIVYFLNIRFVSGHSLSLFRTLCLLRTYYDRSGKISVRTAFYSHCNSGYPLHSISPGFCKSIC